MKEYKLPVSEIFFSFQGEGPYIGMPAIFIRLFGCNVGCKWCDTPQSLSGNHSTMTIREIVDKVRSHPCNNIIITGGEPLIHLTEAIASLIDALDYRAKNVHLLTSVASTQILRNLEVLSSGCLITGLSPKPPSSGVQMPSELISGILRFADHIALYHPLQKVYFNFSVDVDNEEDIQFVRSFCVPLIVGGKVPICVTTLDPRTAETYNNPILYLHRTKRLMEKLLEHQEGLLDMVEGSSQLRILPQLHKLVGELSCQHLQTF